MARFGQYQTDRPLYRTGFNAIYLWRSGTKGSGPRIIKVYESSARVRDERTPAAESVAFLDSASIQQKAASEDARYWAPIHESGTSPQGAFYVTDYYDLSAQQLIDGRVSLGTAGLYHIVESVTKGLLALKRACGRPHGNLKFTNILIARRRVLTREKVVLSDPCPSSLLDEDTHAKMDLVQLGVLIHQLVMHRNPPLVAGYQAPDSPEWQRLGRRANAWRDLCNRLLTMDAQTKPLTLEELAARLPGIARRGQDRAIKAAVCVGAVVLLAGLFRLAASWIGGLPPDPNDAYELCWEAQNWLGPLRDRLGEIVPEVGKKRQDYWAQDEDLKNLTILVYHEYGEFLAAKELTDSNTPPKRLATKQYRTTVLEANEARTEIETILSNWSVPKRLVADANNLSKAGCQAMADYMNVRLRSVRHHGTELAMHIDDILYLNKNWYAVQYGEVEPNAVKDDPPVQNKKDFVERLKALPNHYKQDIPDFDRLVEEGKRLREKLDDVIESGDKEAEPLKPEVHEGIPSLIEEIRSIPFTRANIERVTQKCTTVQEKILAIDGQIRDAGQWFDLWRLEAESGISSSRAMNEAFRAQLDAWIGRDRSTFVDKYRGDWTGLSHLKGKVNQTRDNLQRLNASLLRTLAVGIQEISLYDEIEQWQKNLLMLDRDKGLPKALAAESTPAAWIQEVSQYYYEKKREDLIREITNKLAQQEPFPDPNGYPENCKKLLNWPADATAVMGHFAAIESRMNAWYGYVEPMGTTQDTRTIKELYDTCRGTALVKELEEQSTSLVELLGRVKMLERIDGTDDANGLVKIALESRAEAVHAAWVRLEAVDPNWPSDSEQWESEQNIQASLKHALTSLSTNGRVSSVRVGTLQDEFERTRDEREKAFRLAEVKRYFRQIAVRTGEDRILEKLVAVRLSPEDSLPTIRGYRDLAERVATFVATDWPHEYDRAKFYEPDEQGRRFPPDIAVTPDVMGDWLAKMHPDYRIIREDPTVLGGWDRKVKDLREEITEGIKEAADTADREAQTSLEGDRGELNKLDKDFSAVKGVAAIQKYKDRVELRQRLWETNLPDLESKVKSHIRPAYCTRLQISRGVVVFRSGLSAKVFEPVQYKGGGFEPLKLDNLREFETHPPLKADFFEKTEGSGPSDKLSIGWPKYICTIKDRSVILRFVPQADSRDPPPFYMAVGEITNQQFLTFLVGTNIGDAKKWLRDDVDETFYRSGIEPSTPGFRRRRVYESGKVEPFPDMADRPVVWVTYAGAEAYAAWLMNTGLPKASWHERAAEYSHPSSRKRFDDAMLYHIRADQYWMKVRDWKDSQPNKDRRDVAGFNEAFEKSEKARAAGIYEPVGAVREESGLPDPPAPPWPHGIYEGVYPMATMNLPDLKLYDLLGNVWEWCEDSSGKAIICGGSCLSPLEYIDPSAKHAPPRRGAECDLGFRVAIRCP